MKFEELNERLTFILLVVFGVAFTAMTVIQVVKFSERPVYESKR